MDILNVMEAHLSLMELENIRILKEMRGNVNRQVNCETANINKTVSAAVKQIEDIEFIRDTVGFESLFRMVLHRLQGQGFKTGSDTEGTGRRPGTAGWKIRCQPSPEEAW